MISHTIRVLSKSPGFALASILALALGIGANTAIFSLVNAVLLRPLPYHEPERLVMLWQKPPSGGMNDLSAADYQDWYDRNHLFASMAAITGPGFNLSVSDRPERVSGLSVTSAFFSTLGVLPAIGRAFLPEEDKPGEGRSVILSDTLWKRRFGGDPQLIGHAIRMDRQNYTVVGVMPPGFQFAGNEYELWTPLVLDPNRTKRNFYYLQAVARLRNGVTVQQARTEMETIARQLALEYPATNQNWTADVVSLRDHVAGAARKPILMLLGAVAFVLLIACANVANLLLVRAAGRKKEFAIRTALGAGRRDMVRRLLSESILLAIAGGALGILLAHWGIVALVAMHPGDIPRLDEVNIDFRVLGFAVLISLLTGALFGLAPVWQLSKVDLNEALKESARGASNGPRGRRTRSALVVMEFALALVLLIGAGLMIRSFAALQTAHTGFRIDNLLTMNVSVQEQQYGTEQQIASDFDRVVEKLQEIPGVISAAAATNLPVNDWNQGRVMRIDGRAPKSSDEVLGAGYLSISPGYFHTAGIPLRRGREFTTQDRHGAPDVIVISESMARRYWPVEDPIGKRIICASRQFRGRGLGAQIPREIVGVVGDVRHLGTDNPEASIEMYVPQMQNTLPFTYLLVRTAGNPTGVKQAASRAVNEILKDSPVAGIKTIEERLAERFSRPRFQMVVLGVFAGVALLLAAIGIYAVMAYSVTQRTHEIGIRMAVGADARQIVSMVLANGLKLALAGVAFGLAAAYGCTRLIASLLYGIAPTDALTFGGVAALLVLTAALASFIPAWRASKMDPARTLRSQL
jgi:putative ABC transport system permease protein